MENLKMLLSDYTFQTVAIGAGLLGLISGILGSFAVLRKQSLLGDGISHAALPGVIAAFLLTGIKNTEILLLGAFISGILATFLIYAIVKNSHIRFDSALALIMSVFFGLGLVLLTYVQKIPNANQAGLKRFIYGQASTLLIRDVYIMAGCCMVLLFIVLLFWKEFKLFTFDSAFSSSIGFSYNKINLMLSFLLVTAIILGLQTVGVVLMSAMLITPAAAARQWVKSLWSMTLVSAIFGALSGIAGTLISSVIPQMPTGPSIVLCISSIAIFSILFAPKRGVLSKIIQRNRQRTSIKMEGRNIDVTRI